ncbi:MAG: immunoglobulin domain-containing protein [Proteobacteria bacterium]|nr:immunoglobulin domain-containing protein [Pseudomonadota bacterium]
MMPHPIILGEELRLSCGYMGVPEPTVQFFQNSMLLMDGMNGVTIIGGAPGDNEITLVISSVGRMSGGTYTCRANNSVGMDEVVYSVIIQGR